MDGMVDDGDTPDIKPIPLSSESTVLESSGGGGGDGPQNGTTPVSIVHVTIPRRLSQMQVQSVIQPNQQSVIQTTAGLQTVQLATGVKGGNVILLNKGGGSVIHTPSSHSAINVVEAGGGDDGLSEEEAAKKRREILARRPSYRKILNDLTVDKGGDSPGASESGQDGETVTISSSGSVIGSQHYQGSGILKVIPGAIQLASSNSSQTDGLQTLMTTGTTGGAIVHYAQGQDGQFFVPGSHLNDTLTVSGGDLQGYRIQAVTTNTGSLGQGLVVASSQGEHIVEEASRKREIRLLKNREAARECRRKKKEYIKCLENRVAVLENQNKALIEELKSLKDLYCSQKAE